MLDICLERLAGLREQCDAGVFVACYDGDREIVEAARAAGVHVIPMGFDAVNASNWVAIYSEFGSFLQREGFGWALHTHSACHPFVRPETILQAADYCRVAVKPFIIAAEERTIAWSRNESGEPVEVVASEFLDSRSSPPLIRPTHIGGACSVEAMFREDGMSDAVPFVPAGLQAIEMLDCDTPDQLELLQVVAEGMSQRGRHVVEVYCDGPLAGRAKGAKA